MSNQAPPYHPGTGNEAHRLTTWQDLQDLRKDLEGVIDVKLDLLQADMYSRFDSLHDRLGKLERLIAEHLMPSP